MMEIHHHHHHYHHHASSSSSSHHPHMKQLVTAGLQSGQLLQNVKRWGMEKLANKSNMTEGF